jgi:hypothetical protein
VTFCRVSRYAHSQAGKWEPPWKSVQLVAIALFYTVKLMKKFEES